MDKVRKTVADALIEYLQNQYVVRDGKEQAFFGGCFGIFGHGNVAGIGQALKDHSDFTYYQCRNEQAMVHTAVAYAKANNRLSTMVCTSSIGPGATNMVTGAALATINRLPVLLLPGDIFADRRAQPVLQQLEVTQTQDASVNDCFKPVSTYWDRINRPEQLESALKRAMQVLTSPAMTGCVTLCIPQDVQVEYSNFSTALFEKKVWYIPRIRPDQFILNQAVQLIKTAQRPLIIAGGGVIYSDAIPELSALVEKTSLPFAETMAGKGALPYDHKGNLGAIGVTGTEGAVRIAEQADLIIGIGTRYTDFTTSSQTLFKNDKVRFININVAEMDLYKQDAIALQGDAKVILQKLITALEDDIVSTEYIQEIRRYSLGWDRKVSDYYQKESIPLKQSEIIGVINEYSASDTTVVCASGSLPGDLHKLWRARGAKNFHMEYGYSCMGYEIAGGLGVKMASPEKEVIVMVGDGSYLMMSQEIITSIQENLKLIIILINNDGFKSIGSLSRSIGQDGFGTRYFTRVEGSIGDDQLSREEAQSRKLPVDFVQNAKSMGAIVYKALTKADLIGAFKQAQDNSSTTLIYTECDRYEELETYSWWDVPNNSKS